MTNPEEPRKRVAPSLGFVEPCETGSLLHIGADDTAWLASYLIGLDLSFEVLRPPELRADLHRMGVRLAGTHELASRQEGVNHTPSDRPVPEEGEPPHQAH